MTDKDQKLLDFLSSLDVVRSHKKGGICHEAHDAELCCLTLKSNAWKLTPKGRTRLAELRFAPQDAPTPLVSVDPLLRLGCVSVQRIELLRLAVEMYRGGARRVADRLIELIGIEEDDHG